MEIQIERQVLTFQPLHFVALADRLLVTIETPILNENRTDCKPVKLPGPLRNRPQAHVDCCVLLFSFNIGPLPEYLLLS